MSVLVVPLIVGCVVVASVVAGTGVRSSSMSSVLVPSIIAGWSRVCGGGFGVVEVESVPVGRFGVVGSNSELLSSWEEWSNDLGDYSLCSESWSNDLGDYSGSN